MAVDWSVVWANILQGVIITAIGAFSASIVTIRYQKRKHKKEIIENLVQQQHELEVKFTIWSNKINRLFAFEYVNVEDTIANVLDFNKKLNTLIYKYQSDVPSFKEIQKIELASKDMSIKSDQLIKEQEILTNIWIIRSEISLDFLLLTKKMQVRLNLKNEDLDEFKDIDTILLNISGGIIKGRRIGYSEEQKKIIYEQINQITFYLIEVFNLIVKQRRKYCRKKN